MIDKRKLLTDYLNNIENSDIKRIALQVLNIETNTQKPKTEKIRDIKRIIETITNYEN